MVVRSFAFVPARIMEPQSITNATALFQAVDQLVDQQFDQLVQWRRHFHSHPELSWQEVATTRKLDQILNEHGLATRRGARDRGLIVDLDHQADPTVPRLAFRADIDAIPVQDLKSVPYKSGMDGIAHACGHDVHMTVLVGVLLTLSEIARSHPNVPPFRVRGIFQPAEEVAQGSREMIEMGSIEDVDAILAIHVDSSASVGQIGLKPGVQTAACDELVVTVRGEGGHGARPHETSDPIFAAIQFVSSVYSRYPRIVDSRDPAVVSFCKISGGSTSNVVPSQVDLRGTMRTLSGAVQRRVQQEMQVIAASISRITGTEIDVHFGPSVPAVVNDPELCQLVTRAADQFLGPDATRRIEASMGSEDFACYTAELPGVLIRVGSSSDHVQGFPLHSSYFDVDDGAIPIAIRLLIRALFLWSEQPRGRRAEVIVG